MDDFDRKLYLGRWSKTLDITREDIKDNVQLVDATVTNGFIFELRFLCPTIKSDVQCAQKLQRLEPTLVSCKLLTLAKRIKDVCDKIKKYLKNGDAYIDVYLAETFDFIRRMRMTQKALASAGESATRVAAIPRPSTSTSALNPNSPKKVSTSYTDYLAKKKKARAKYSFLRKRKKKKGVIKKSITVSCTTLDFNNPPSPSAQPNPTAESDDDAVSIAAEEAPTLISDDEHQPQTSEQGGPMAGAAAAALGICDPPDLEENSTFENSLFENTPSGNFTLEYSNIPNSNMEYSNIENSTPENPNDLNDGADDCEITAIDQRLESSPSPQLAQETPFIEVEETPEYIEAADDVVEGGVAHLHPEQPLMPTDMEKGGANSEKAKRDTEPTKSNQKHTEEISSKPEPLWKQELERLSRHPPDVRLKLSDLGAQLVCTLCGGFIYNATTISECMHTFCRKCILFHIEFHKTCPSCKHLIDPSNPYSHLRPDSTFQEIVNKLVPEFAKEERRKREEFYIERGYTCDDLPPDAGHVTQANSLERKYNQKSKRQVKRWLSIHLEFLGYDEQVVPHVDELKCPYVHVPESTQVRHVQAMLAKKLGLSDYFQALIFFDQYLLHSDMKMSGIEALFHIEEEDSADDTEMILPLLYGIVPKGHDHFNIAEVDQGLEHALNASAPVVDDGTGGGVPQPPSSLPSSDATAETPSYTNNIDINNPLAATLPGSGVPLNDDAPSSTSTQFDSVMATINDVVEELSNDSFTGGQSMDTTPGELPPTPTEDTPAMKKRRAASKTKYVWVCCLCHNEQRNIYCHLSIVHKLKGDERRQMSQKCTRSLVDAATGEVVKTTLGHEFVSLSEGGEGDEEGFDVPTLSSQDEDDEGAEGEGEMRGQGVTEDEGSEAEVEVRGQRVGGGIEEGAGEAEVRGELRDGLEEGEVLVGVRGEKEEGDKSEMREMDGVETEEIGDSGVGGAILLDDQEGLLVNEDGESQHEMAMEES